jgi:hypothetical protein
MRVEIPDRLRAIPDRLRALERPFLDKVKACLRDAAGGDDETYWYVAWRLELDSVNRNLVDHQKVRKRLFDEQHGLCS